MTSSQFFDAPEQQSIIKSQIVTKYFGAWSKIVLPRDARHSQRIAYTDLFSGPGKFADGSYSTPLLILDSAVKDEALRRHLVTMFNDKEPMFVEQLKEAINTLPGIETLTYRPEISNTAVGSEVVEILGRTKLVPTLFFIDPWGYKGLSLHLIGTAIRNWGCECIFFFNYNRINPGLSNPFVATPMGELFGVEQFEELRAQVSNLTARERRQTVISAMTESLKAVGGRYVLPFGIRSQHGERTSHYIIFVSKHILGYKIMKDVMAGLSSDNDEVRSFEYVPVKSAQLPLLDPDNPYSIPALKEILTRSCAGKAMTVDDIYEKCTVDTPYLLRNVKKAIIELETEGRVTISSRRKGTLAGNKIVTFPP